MKPYRNTLVVMGLLMLAGCAHNDMALTSLATPEAGPATQPSAEAQVANAAPENTTGSLWDTRKAGSLFEDVRARNVGDLITIHVVEDAKGTRNAATNTARKSSLSTAITRFFTSPIAGRNLDLGSTNTYDGTGATTRSGTLTALVSATVVQVMPNGNLVIEGKRAVQVNNETQIIKLNGTVRPVDISTDNVVLSSRIADAKIVYTGEGVVDEKQRPGWFARLFDYITPF